MSESIPKVNYGDRKIVLLKPHLDRGVCNYLICLKPVVLKIFKFLLF